MVDETVRQLVKRGDLVVCLTENRFRNDQTLVVTTEEDATTRRPDETLTGEEALSWIDDPASACGSDSFHGTIEVSPDAMDAASKQS